MNESLFSIEVFYNRDGKIMVGRGDHPIYHTLQINAWAYTTHEAEDKVRKWFAKQKPEFKIINLLTLQSL